MAEVIDTDPGAAPDTGAPRVERLRGRALAARLVATALGLALLLAGTLFGTDDDFPFGPFRMFATTNEWSEPISIARAEVADAAGRTIELTPANSGVRRAEIEGQLGRFRADPRALTGLADAYRAHNPAAPAPRTVTVFLRHHEISRAGPTGRYTDEVVATWALS
jgi:hypothetical protein